MIEWHNTPVFCEALHCCPQVNKVKILSNIITFPCLGYNKIVTERYNIAVWLVDYKIINILKKPVKRVTSQVTINGHAGCKFLQNVPAHMMHYGMLMFILGLWEVFARIKPGLASPGYRTNLCASTDCHRFFLMVLPEFITIHWAIVVNTLTKGITTVWRHWASNTEAELHLLPSQRLNHSATNPKLRGVHSLLIVFLKCLRQYHVTI